MNTTIQDADDRETNPSSLHYNPISKPAAPRTLDFQQGTNVKDYWRVILRRRWIVISFTTIVTLAVAIMSFLTPPLYRASTTIVIDSEVSDGLNPSENSAKGVSFDIFENYIKTQMALILSRSVAGKVFDELHLADLPRYQGEPHPIKRYFQKWSKRFSRFFSSAPESHLKADPMQRFLHDIELERIKGTRALQISVLNPNAAMAADIANRIAERYARDNMMRRALRFIQNQRMATLNADYLRLKGEYDRLSHLYGPKHHLIISLKDEIRALAERIDKEQENNQSIQKSIDRITLTAKTPDEEEKLLADILQQIQATSVLSSSQMNNIAVADPAVPPSEVAVPNKKKDIALGLLAGLAMGIFLAFLVDYLDDTLKGEEDLKKVIGNENYIGSIPYDDRIKGFHRMAKMDRLMVQKPLSGSAEAYRLIRLQLHWMLQKNPSFKDFAIISSIPDEGKSTISSNLAISLAQLDQKVLLVDTDIRRGRLQRTYQTSARMGLGQYLTDGLRFGDIVQKTKISNLWLVTPGESIIMGSELLSSPRMFEFIQECRRHFDIILYDTAPITLISDASVLLGHLHGAILVTRTGVTRSRIVPKSIQMIRNANTKLIGVVLNSAMPEENNKYYHRYYRD